MVPLWDRVWAKVAINDDTDACWLWTGATSKKRRGQRRPHIRQGRRGSPMLSVARQICEWYHGLAPSDVHEAGHLCPNGENCLCVNPRHLQWMTREENEQHKHSYPLEQVA